MSNPTHESDDDVRGSDVRDSDVRDSDVRDPSDEAGDAEGETASARRLWKVLLPIVALVVAAGGTAALFSARETPLRTERKSLGPLVETLDASVTDVALTVAGHGEVSARIAVDLLSEVPGKVTWVHPDLRSGGRFGAGETLLRVDDRDYRLAVERARAAVARAETGLEREQAEAEVARQEWRAMNGDETPPALLVRGPQIRQADAELAAARADLAAAELSLERTRLSLPFDGIVVSENVSPGQFVSSGRAIATVNGTAEVEIRVPLPDAELAWFDISAGPEPTEATVRVELAGRAWTWPGVVERLEGQVDPKSRMVYVVVRVDSPFDAPFAASFDGPGDETDRGSDLHTAARPPLLPGTFVEVAIAGRVLEQVVQLPRFALREGGVVWVAAPGEVDAAQATDSDPADPAADPAAEPATGAVLRLRQVEVVRTDREHAFVRGLAAGERVITSSLDVPVDGMAVRPAESSP